MESKPYEGSHRDLFEAFLTLVDDSAAQTQALLDLTDWEEVRSILSVGGGEGIVEATLLRQAPRAKLWYLDPSTEQCHAFRAYMAGEGLLDRVEEVAEMTFQAYPPPQRFDRTVALFSWFYIGTEDRWLRKLLDLLEPQGTACLILPNENSIEADFNRSLSPDERTNLVGADVVKALEVHPCHVTQYTATKWLAEDDVRDGDDLSVAALAFAGFVAMRPIAALSETDRKWILDLIDARLEAEGVPLIWDVLVVRHA